MRKTVELQLKSMLTVIITLTIGMLFIISLSREITRVRLYELDMKFRKMNRLDSNRDSLGLFLKFRLQKDLFEGTVKEEETGLKELERMYLTSDHSTGLKKERADISPVVLFLVNAVMFNQYLQDTEVHLRRLDGMKSGLNTPEKLYQLISYRKALSILDTLSIKSLTGEERSYVEYYRARCFEETGNSTEALSAYQSIIINDPDSPYAAMSNRRIYTIGKIDIVHQGALEVAQMNNELIKDTGFTDFVQSTDKYAVENEYKDTFLNRIEKTQTGTGIVEDMKRARDKALYERNRSELLPSEVVIEAKRPERVRKKNVYRNESVRITDSSGKVVKSVYYNDEGRIEYYNTLTYTKSGLPDTMYQYTPSHELQFYYKYEYDNSGNRSKIRKYDEKGKELSMPEITE